jgi:hypothetical protein
LSVEFLFRERKTALDGSQWKVQFKRDLGVRALTEESEIQRAQLFRR